MNIRTEAGEIEVMSTAEKDPFAGVSERTLKYLPLYILVPVMYGAVFSAAGHAIDWTIFGLGALGWLVALFLRGPLAALVRELPQERAKLIVGGSSGVLEEGVRLALLAILSASFPQALSLGQGWAAIEVLFVIVNAIIIVSLIKRTDEKAMQAKQILQAQGNLQASPLWGILERIWASAFHIGAALIIARTPWSAVLLIPLHSGFNLTAVRLARTAALPLVSLFAAGVGLLTLTAGLLLW